MQPIQEYADTQFHFVPSQYVDHGQSPPDREAYQIHVETLRSKSVGSVHVKSTGNLMSPVKGLQSHTL